MPEDGEEKPDDRARQLSLDGDGDGDAAWMDIAKQVTVEKDPVKMAELCKQLNEAMLAEERRKIAKRFEANRDRRTNP